MFLVEFRKGQFVNAGMINWISLGAENVIFTVSTDEQSTFTVSTECESLFLNHLQGLNGNICNISSARAEILAENKSL